MLIVFAPDRAHRDSKDLVDTFFKISCACLITKLSGLMHRIHVRGPGSFCCFPPSSSPPLLGRVGRLLIFYPAHFDLYQAEHRDDILFRVFVILLFSDDLHAKDQQIELFQRFLLTFQNHSST